MGCHVAGRGRSVVAYGVGSLIRDARAATLTLCGPRWGSRGAVRSRRASPSRRPRADPRYSLHRIVRTGSTCLSSWLSCGSASGRTSHRSPSFGVARPLDTCNAIIRQRPTGKERWLSPAALYSVFNRRRPFALNRRARDSLECLVSRVARKRSFFFFSGANRALAGGLQASSDLPVTVRRGDGLILRQFC